MQVKEGTVMIEIPREGAPSAECIVCTGPGGVAQEAFVAGMGAGIQALRGNRPRMCVAHETYFRECLSAFECTDAETLTKLGIPFKVADGTEDVDNVRS